MEKITFKTPVTFEGKEIESIDLDFEKIKGRQIKNCHARIRKSMAAMGEMPIAVETDPEFLMMLAGIAAEQPYEMFDELPAADYMAVLGATRNFLFSGQ